MNSIKSLLKRIERPTWVGIVVLIVAIVVIIFSSRLLYNRTVDLLTENLRQRILTISITAAASVDPNNLEALQVEEDWQKPEWSRVVNRLHKVKYSNDDIVFMYIFRKTKDDPTKMEFVADADSIDPFANTSTDTSKYVDVNRDGKVEPDGPDKLQWPGQPYPEASDIFETFEAYSAPLTSKDLYTDEYGTVITGYAPITDENGNTVAVLATDIKADDFFIITTQTLRPFLVFIVFLTIVISILTIILIYAWRRYSKFLEKSNNDKSEFVSFATHQLRAPLTAMKGYTSLILEGEMGETNPEVKQAVSRIYDSSKTLANIVDDYLNISRIELGTMKYTFDSLDLKNLVESVIGELKPNLEKKNLKLDFAKAEGSFMVHADQDKLKQVIANLIDNSVKYTPSGSINISISKKVSDGKVLLSIKDTGVGIAKEVMPKLFEKFVRADNANRQNIYGTGLGLYVAKQIVQAHKGKIWAQSEGDGKGSTFFLELDMEG